MLPVYTLFYVHLPFPAQDSESLEAKLLFRLLDMCFAMLPRLQVVDVQAGHVVL